MSAPPLHLAMLVAAFTVFGVSLFAVSTWLRLTR